MSGRLRPAATKDFAPFIPLYAGAGFSRPVRSASMAKKKAPARKPAKTTARTASRAKAAPARAKKPALQPSMKAGRFVYQFGARTDGNGSMKPLLGGKGANLAE